MNIAINRPSQLLALRPIILRGDDLPLPVAFQPCIRPDQATSTLHSFVVLFYSAFRSIEHGQILTEKMHSDITESAFASFVLNVFGLRIPFSARSRSFEIVGQRCLRGQIAVTVRFCPLAFHVS